MDKVAFDNLFDRIAREAIQKAEETFGHSIPHDYSVELSAFGFAGKTISAEEALKHLYIDSKTTYLIIDVAVKYVTDDVTVLFIRPSGHAPAAFSQAWNTPEANGPFKIMIPKTLSKDQSK